MQILFVARKPLRRSSTSEAQASIVECDFVGARRNPLPRSCMSDVQKCRAFACASATVRGDGACFSAASQCKSISSAKAFECKSFSVQKPLKAFVCNS